MPAQETEEEDAGGFIVGLLEDALSGDNRNIRVTGLEGTLSGRATIDRLTVSDDQGVWLTLEDAVLDWNRLALVRGRFSVNELSADEIVVARAPNPPENPPLPDPEAAPFQIPELPVSVEIGQLAVDRLELGEPLLGRSAVLGIEGSLSLADGALETALEARRLDRRGDALTLQASYSNETRVIGLDLDFREEAGGLVATLLDVPDEPPMRLAVEGEGPVSDFRANIALDSAGEQRLGGVVTLRDAPAPEPGAPDEAAPEGAILFNARLDGDVRELLEPEFHAFFGGTTAFDLSGRRDGDGALEIERFALTSSALDLEGGLRLGPGGRPQAGRLAGRIEPPSGESVVLPVGGGDTRVRAVTLDGALEATGGGASDWRLSLVADDLDNPQVALGRGDLRAEGRIAEDGDITGQLRAALERLALTDPALDRAIGERVTLETGFATPGDGTFTLNDLRLTGPGLAVTAEASVDGLDAGYAVDGNATVRAADLSRFSDLAGQDLAGRIDARLAGQVVPLWGQFDLRLDAQAQDLGTGIAPVDSLIGGRSTLVVDAARDEDGLRLRNLVLDAPQLEASADGIVRSAGSDLNFDLALADLGALVPQAPGRLTASGAVQERDGVVSGTVTATGPTDSRAELTGDYTLETGDAQLVFDATVNRIERFVAELSGAVAARGEARLSGDTWTVDSAVDAPAGTTARVTGTYDQARNLADLRVSGAARLGVVNRLISPMSISGPANFDLSVQGPPALESVSGTVTTSGTSVAIPQVGNALQDVSGSVQLASGQALVALRGAVRSGGSVEVNGPITLEPPLPAQLTAVLNGIELTDNALYETVIDGRLVLSGPLLASPTLSGRIDVGETNINIAAGGGAAGAAPIPENIVHLNESAAERATRARAGLIKTADAGGPGVNLGLDVTVSAPSRIFVRGRGLQAELGGQLYVGGSTANAVPSGSIDLIRGTLELFGNRLELTRGTVTLQGQLVPYIEFVATTQTSSGQATLEIAGALPRPEVTVESSPARPPEEALAMLVFGDDFTELSPIRLAQMAAALARLSGSGGGTTESLRQGLGVDTLNLGVGDDGVAEVGAGTYLSDNVYTDVIVNARGETELNLNLDLTDSLSVRGSVDNEGETGLGIFFERDY